MKVSVKNRRNRRIGGKNYIPQAPKLRKILIKGYHNNYYMRSTMVTEYTGKFGSLRAKQEVF